MTRIFHTFTSKRHPATIKIARRSQQIWQDKESLCLTASFIADLFGVSLFSMFRLTLLQTFNELDNCLAILFFCVTSYFLLFDWIRLLGSRIYYGIVTVCYQPTTFLLD